MITVKRFTATWCAPCKALAPVFTTLEKELIDIKFETIDIEQDPDQTSKYKVRSVPTVVILENDEVKDMILGLNPKQKYIEAIQK